MIPPRRLRIDQMSPAELAIRDATLAVEKAGAHSFLTDATYHLDRAQECVADFVDLDETKDVVRSEETGAAAASAAGRVLRDPTSSADAKSAAASALTQRELD